LPALGAVVRPGALTVFVQVCAAQALGYPNNKAQFVVDAKRATCKSLAWASCGKSWPPGGKRAKLS
jgi:hypothetical protein